MELRNGSRGATKIARVPKDAQRSIDFEEKKKNLDFACFALLWPANVLPNLLKKHKIPVFRVFTKIKPATSFKSDKPESKFLAFLKLQNPLFLTKKKFAQIINS